MTAVYFILILGITIFVHELGHFIFAKRAKIHVYEFALGMGPKIFSFNRKNDETTYAIRLFPIGGFVQMAGETNEEDNDVSKDKLLTSKTWKERFLTIIAGIVFNFIFAFILLFIIGLFYGSQPLKPIVKETVEGSIAYKAGLKSNDQIIELNGKKIISLDHFLLELSKKELDQIEFKLKNNNEIRTVSFKFDSENLGIMLDGRVKTGFVNAISYAFFKTIYVVHQMMLVIWYLITGALSLSMLSGPIGIFSIVGDAAKFGFINLIYLNAIISINVAFINLMPIPAFDGGRLLFLLIEKIKGKPINPKVENTIHAVGFVFLMILMILITFNDILRIFK